MKKIFNPLLTEKPEKRLRKCYLLKEIKKETKKSYFKWRKEINNNNDLFENLYFAACQQEAQLIELYDKYISSAVVIAENHNGEIIGGDSFNKIYDTLEGDYYHYRDKEALILVNTCDKSKKWHFYKKPNNKSGRLEIFAPLTTEDSLSTDEKEVEKCESENTENNESEEYEDATEENSDC